MNLIVIDKNIPQPDAKRGGRRGSKYPWNEMKVGDSFLFPENVKKTTAASLTYSAGKAHKRQFSLRTVEDGIRCWRKA